MKETRHCSPNPALGTEIGGRVLAVQYPVSLSEGGQSPTIQVVVKLAET